MAVKQSDAKPTRKRLKIEVGQVVAVPLIDGTFGLAHVVVSERPKARAVTLVIPEMRVPSLANAAEWLDEALKKPVGAIVTGRYEIQTGVWPIVGSRTPDYSGFDMPRDMDGKHSYHTEGGVPDFIESYHGLRSWDHSERWPYWNNPMLLHGVPVPLTARYRRSLAELRAQHPNLSRDAWLIVCSGRIPWEDPLFSQRIPWSGPDPDAPTSPSASPPPVTEGPALITIQLVYPGTGLPSTDLLRKRQELERRLEAAGAGEIEGAESGRGVMEIFLRTDEVRRAVPLVEKTAAELGFADDLLVETAPLEDAEEDNDER